MNKMQKKKRYYIILNPHSGRGKAGKLRPKIEEALNQKNIDFNLVETQGQGHAEKLAQEAPPEFDVVVVAGGDGTANEVANGLMKNPRPMGLIPTGSGNDFARAMGIPFQWQKAIDVLFQNQEKRIDVGWVNGRYFPNGFGVGFDALVVQESAKVTRLRGLLIYLYAVLKSIFFYSSPNLSILLDADRKIESRIFMLTVGNGVSLGGGFLLTPNARNNDGIFDICVIHHLSKPQIFWHLPKVFWGGHVKIKQVEMLQAKELVVKSSEPVGGHVDGELVEMNDREFRVKIFPKALTIIGGISGV